jgi:hypothetical protein
MLYREAAGDPAEPSRTGPLVSPGPGAIQTALPSPDGTRIAFDRLPPGNKRSGIWLLDLRSRRCRQVTFPTEGFSHLLLRWEGDSAVLAGCVPGPPQMFRLELSRGLR